MTFRGCASSECGTAYSSTAVAPNDPMRNRFADPESPSWRVGAATAVIPMSAVTHVCTVVYGCGRFRSCDVPRIRLRYVTSRDDCTLWDIPGGNNMLRAAPLSRRPGRLTAWGPAVSRGARNGSD